MIAELEVAIEDLREKLIELQDKREMFRLANEDTMVEFLYQKRIKEFDKEIADIEEQIRGLQDEYYEVLERYT